MTVLVYANRKGGVGKTTNSVLTAYELAKLGYKTLVCDLDPQASATHLLSRTYSRQNNLSQKEYIREIIKRNKKGNKKLTQEEITKHLLDDFSKIEKNSLRIKKTMMLALSEENISSAIVEIRKNLFLLPSDDDFDNYPDFLEQLFPPVEPNYIEKRMAYFGLQLEKIKDNYDYVVIDVPPTRSIYTDSAIYTSDDVIVVLQTQQDSFDGAVKFYGYLQKMFDKYSEIDFNVLGVLPVILHKGAGLDAQILRDANESFGGAAVLNTIIPYKERIKRYGRLGIADQNEKYNHIEDHYDRDAHDLYKKLAKEIIERLKNEVKD